MPSFRDAREAMNDWLTGVLDQPLVAVGSDEWHQRRALGLEVG